MQAVTFPTELAVSLATTVGILDHRYDWNQFGGLRLKPDYEAEMDDAEKIYALDEATEKVLRLAAFQKIAAIGDFKKAVIIYSLEDLSEDQVGILELIAQFTPDFIKSEVAEHLVSILPRDNKSAAAIATALVHLMGGDGADPKELGKLNGQASGVVKKFVMELTGE